MKKQIVKTNTLGVILMLFAIFSLFSATAFGQISNPFGNSGALKEEQKKARIRNLHFEAFEVGAQMSYAVYYAALTEAEAKKGKTPQADLLKARTDALNKAIKAAKEFNSLFANESNHLDIAQFKAKFAGAIDESNSYTKAYLIHANLGSKLFQISKHLNEAYYLGWHTGSAEINAANGDANRKAVTEQLKAAGETAKKARVYNAANSTLVDLAQDKTPMTDILPKIVSLRQWYHLAVTNYAKTNPAVQNL